MDANKEEVPTQIDMIKEWTIYVMFKAVELIAKALVY